MIAIDAALCPPAPDQLIETGVNQIDDDGAFVVDHWRAVVYLVVRDVARVEIPRLDLLGHAHVVVHEQIGQPQAGHLLEPAATQFGFDAGSYVGVEDLVVVEPRIARRQRLGGPPPVALVAGKRGATLQIRIRRHARARRPRAREATAADAADAVSAR